MRASELPPGTYDVITDDQIRDAVKFPDWHPNHFKWSEPDRQNPLCHAYHIQRLVETMQRLRCWCGGDPYQWKTGLWDGHHRKRAVLYLETAIGMKIEIPPMLREDES